jgi:hypothetical protein
MRQHNIWIGGSGPRHGTIWLIGNENERVRAMTLKEYVLMRLDQEEQDLRVLSREARIRVPSVRRVSSNYLRNIRSAWRQKLPSDSGGQLREFEKLVAEWGGPL